MWTDVEIPEISSWKLMWTDVEVPRDIQLENRVDWCWGTERYPAGNSCGLMLRYREISSWKLVWTNVEVPRDIQLETQSASENFKHRVLDIWCWTRKKFWLFTKATHHGNSWSICWTAVIDILAFFLRHVRQAVSTQDKTAFSHIYSLSTFRHLTSTQNSRRKIIWPWNKERDAKKCKHKSNTTLPQHISQFMHTCISNTYS